MNPTRIDLATAVAVYEAAATIIGSGDHWLVQISDDGLTHISRFKELEAARYAAKGIVLGWKDSLPARGMVLVTCIDPIERYQDELAAEAERDGRRARAKIKAREYARQQRNKAQEMANACA
jgi:hypothetical protein